MRSRKKRFRKSAIWFFVFVLLAVLLVVGFHYEKNSRVQARGTENQQIGVRRRIEHQGATYIEKTGLTTMLLIGTDQGESPEQYNARQGGQADFQMLLVIDPYTESIYRLQIDRDTIAEVEALGILGNPLEPQPMQICLAHAFGMTPQECAQRATRTVERFFPGLETDLYMAFDLASIGLLNDALGGVTVTLEDDFTAYDPTMISGATLTLNAEQAEIFVRNRMEVGDGTNSARMRRQQAYMSSAAQVLKSRIQDDASYINTLFDALGDSLTTNTSGNELANIANRAYHYQLLPIETLPGRHIIGEDGFVEFHADEGAAQNWVIRVLFKPEK